jgi:hypothetical protein
MTLAGRTVTRSSSSLVACAKARGMVRKGRKNLGMGDKKDFFTD